jgi:hypothetical protein
MHRKTERRVDGNSFVLNVEFLVNEDKFLRGE